MLSEAFAQSVRLSLKQNGVSVLLDEIAKAQASRKPVEFVEVINHGVDTAQVRSNVDGGAVDPEAEKKWMVAVVPIIGVITRYGDACSYGTEDLGRWIKQCENEDEIGKIVLDIDSPGGDVNGIETLGNIIKNCSKPVDAYVKASCYSGAYWLASQCRHIYLEPGVITGTGSIGVYGVHQDLQTYERENGVKFTMVRARTSPNKAKGNPFEALDEATLNEWQDRLDAIHARFKGVVKAGRGNKIDKAAFKYLFDGKVFNAEESIKEGLADKIGSRDELISLR